MITGTRNRNNEEEGIETGMDNSDDEASDRSSHRKERPSVVVGKVAGITEQADEQPRRTDKWRFSLWGTTYCISYSPTPTQKQNESSPSSSCSRTRPIRSSADDSDNSDGSDNGNENQRLEEGYSSWDRRPSGRKQPSRKGKKSKF